MSVGDEGVGVDIAVGLASKVLTMYGEGLPVNAEKMASLLGIHIREIPRSVDAEHPSKQNPKCLCSVACWDKNQRIIEINNSLPPKQRRYFIAASFASHMLGLMDPKRPISEVMLDGNPDSHCFSYASQKSFVLELLMPKDLVITVFSDKRTKSIREIGDVFGVPDAAVLMRLRMMSLI